MGDKKNAEGGALKINCGERGSLDVGFVASAGNRRDF